MAFADFIKSIPKTYPANLRLMNKVVDIIQNETGDSGNYAKATGLLPFKYNSVALVGDAKAAPTAKIAFSNSRYASENYVPNKDNFNFCRPGFNTYQNYSAASYSLDSNINQDFADYSELVVYFTYTTVGEYKKSLGSNFGATKCIFVNGQVRWTRWQSSNARNCIDVGGFIAPADWTQTGESGKVPTFENITFEFTDEYDDYLLITDWSIYCYKDSETGERETTNYRPVVYYLTKSYTAYNWTQANANPPMQLKSENGIIQFVCDGTSIAEKIMFVRGTTRNSVPFWQMTRSTGVNEKIFLPTMLLVDRIVNLKGATPLLTDEQNLSMSTNECYGMMLNACELHENISTHIPLYFLQDRTYGNGDAVVFSRDRKYAAITNTSVTCRGGLAFKTVDDIIAYFNDWGLKATPEIDKAKFAPYEDIKDADPLPSPSGGGSGTIKPDFPIEENDEITSIPNNPSDTIDDFLVENPSVSPINLMTNYALNYTSVKALFEWLCDKSFYNNISELFTDKLSAIHALIQYPFDIVRHDTVHTQYSDVLTIVNVSESIPCYSLVNGYNTILYGGEITYISYFGDFRDWVNCKYSIYVPYAGVVDVPPSAVINRTLKLFYCCDLLTGKATAVLKSYENNDNLGALIKTIPCQIGINVPVQSSNYGQQAINNTLTGISMLSNLAGGVIGLATGNPFSFMGLMGGVQQGASLLSQQQTQYSASGGVSPSTGLSLPQTPYLCISRARPAKPSNFAQINGLPSSIYTTLANVASGNALVKMQNVLFKSATATTEEITEVVNQLNNGIYL